MYDSMHYMSNNFWNSTLSYVQPQHRGVHMGRKESGMQISKAQVTPDQMEIWHCVHFLIEKPAESTTSSPFVFVGLLCDSNTDLMLSKEI